MYKNAILPTKSPNPKKREKLKGSDSSRTYRHFLHAYLCCFIAAIVKNVPGKAKIEIAMLDVRRTYVYTGFLNNVWDR